MKLPREFFLQFLAQAVGQVAVLVWLVCCIVLGAWASRYSDWLALGAALVFVLPMIFWIGYLTVRKPMRREFSLRQKASESGE